LTLRQNFINGTQLLSEFVVTRRRIDVLVDERLKTLEDGSASLEESLKLWERGEELAKICQEWLDGAKAKLASVKKDAK
jgi:exodeoxyribonuclease VII small subunit